MKYLVFALLTASVLSLSPSTDLTHQYDDALFNNVNPEFKKIQVDADIQTTVPVAPLLSKIQIMRHCAQNMEGEDYERALPTIIAVVEKAKVSSPNHNYHALFLAMDYELEQMRTYELTVHRNENTLVAILSRKTHDIVKGAKKSFYYETYESPFGIPFINIEKSDVNDPEITPELVEYSKQYLLRAAQIQRGTSHLLGNAAAFAKSATAVVKDIAKTYTEVAKAFRTTVTDKVKKTIKGKGFTKFKSSSRLVRTLGVPANQFDNYMKSFKTLTGMSKSKYKSELKEMLSLARFTMSNDWTVKDFAFSSGKTSSVDAAICLTRAHNSFKAHHFLTVVTSGFFKLAPNALMMTNHLSAAGGIFERKKDYFKYMPKELTKKEMKSIQSLMILNSVNMLAKEFGVKFKLPDSPDSL